MPHDSMIDSSAFWSRVRVSPDCWIWTGTIYSTGYGIVWNRGHREGAHRVAYALSIGAIPDGMFVCHHCDTPACVRPDHLFLGTHDDNMRDAFLKGRKARGESHGSAKLSCDDVEHMKRLR